MPDASKMPARFTITWEDGRYFVSVPNYKGGEVVRADIAEQLAEALRALVEAKALSGVRDLVAGWNGENRPVPYKERHPARLGATLPKTNCGAVYALDEAMQTACKSLSAYDASNGDRQAKEARE